MFGFGRPGAVQAAHFADHLLGQEGEDLVQARRGDLDFVYASNPPILDQRLAAGIKREGETRDTMRRCRDERAAGGEAFGDRTEERRGGKEGGSKCKYRWEPFQ